MIVEDEISVSMELQEMLEENGYDVPCVTDSGEEAVTLARSLKPDLILMDICWLSLYPGKNFLIILINSTNLQLCEHRNIPIFGV